MKRTMLISLLVAATVLTALGRQRPRVALVLGGGGAKGAAEVGALKVIDSLGIRPDLIVGTSIGSVVGGLYATGWTAEQLDTLFSNQEWLNLLTDRREDLGRVPYREVSGVTYIFGFPIIRKGQYKFGVLAGERLTQRLDSMMGHPCPQSFDELPTPFRCVAADLTTATEVVLDSGSVAEAMRASIAIPGVFTPVRRGQWRLVDGGMTNNLPVDVARALGADVVIAIDLAQQQPREHNFSLAEMLGIGGLLDWIVSRPDLKKYTKNCEDADVLIRPQLAGFDVTSFSNISMRRMIRLGEQEARRHADELTAIKDKCK